MSTSSCAAAETSVRHPWLAVTAVGMATFSVVTTEMLPVGLLTPIADTLGTSTGTAGLMISLPALLAALFAPLVVLASGSLDRRKILCGLLTLLVIANIASALAQNMAWMLAARVLVGFCMGGIWAIAGGLASRLVPARSVGLATSVIFGGVAAASVLGVPLGAHIGDLAGWRWAFGVMALFSGLVLALHLAVIPALPAAASATLRQFGNQLRNRRLQAGLLLTLLLVTSHFMAFTFVRPLLLSVSGFDTQWLGALLFAYGFAGIIGNFLAGVAAARRTATTIIAISGGLLLTPLLFLAVGESGIGGGTVLLAWGLAYGGVSVGLMTLMMKAAPGAVEIVAALYVGVFNIGIALGAWTGGQAVDRLGLSANLWLAAGFAAAALLLASGISVAGADKQPGAARN
ncbi:Purine ribonucleoside efflux pump NepI [Janthinobacterium sp. KBS0711]|uniref:MFS transporter n=1 Tax=Janthinobacterium sp. KBS0711 TaxID=1649647 RepID=UPI000627BC13|nr:MFS transporter [Janthinobacterium sp. KBS0711]KKO65045.1 Purine ribonucleoside efflux pump NepI [Janthinobacterium sp. KBS0711]TSD72718.1 MFS transporter [Janthinobacterium sp. KBS0711]